MAIVKCEQGHFYDSQKYDDCPFCKKEQREQNTEVQFREQKTVSAYQMEQDALQKGNGISNQKDSQKETVWLQDALKNSNENEDARTVGIYSKFTGNDFVTGWLVCVGGPERGRDYRLHYGFNRIGRGLMMDICIMEDSMISRNTHCSIVYENRKNEFALVPEGGCLTYYGGDVLTEPMKLNSGDRFRIGETELEFIAFCREAVRWEEE